MSIRKFLLLNLLLAITITTTLTAIGNYYLDQKDIQDHLDSLMALSTLSYQSLLSHDLNQKDINKVQNALNKIPQKFQQYYEGKQLGQLTTRFDNQFIFQVWSEDGKLLLHSPHAPLMPLTTGKEGFSSKQIDDNLWRVFTSFDDNTGVTTVVAERYDNRDKLGHVIAQDDIYIMLLIFPLSGLLIWIIIGRGLSSIDRVAKEVSNRAPTYLEPVDVKGVPTEIKPLIDELNKLFLRLQQAFDREKRFAADAAHELRTPLAALKTQAQVALMAEDDLERKEALTKVVSGVDRGTHIIQQLLTMSRLIPEATHLDDSTEVNLSKLAAEIVAQLVPSAVTKNIDIELETDSQVITVFGNVTALSILIRNLVDNAIRYTPKDGRVLVAVEEHGTFNILRVTDNGPGIPAELRARVFERFFRVLGNKTPGSGLGLAIVQQIASLHRAQVKLGAPKSGTGLAIEVKFPKGGVTQS
jgi:two-component system, OmpR family, sensor histidine kinase QseC